MEIFICLCPRDSSQSILDFDAFARDQHLPLGSIVPIFLRAMDIRVISFDTVILVIQGWLKIALCIYGVSVCCCKRSKVKPNFDCLQRVDSAIVCIYQATIVTSSEVPKGRFRKAISHYFTGFLARISQFDQMTSQGFCISMSMWWPKTEDIGIHIKRSSKWYSHLTCTAVCVQ